MSQESINNIRTWMAEHTLDAFLVTQPQNRSYLSGWFEDSLEAGLLLLGQQQQFVLTSAIYAEVAQHEASGWEVITITSGPDYAKTIATKAQEQQWQKIGFEASALTYATYDEFAQAGKDIFTLQPFPKSPIDALRLVKQPWELDLLKRAIAITDETFAHLCSWIQPGMTEKQVEWEILRTMADLGADGPSFSPIVASGPNGSMPHAVPGQRQIQRGELITVDMGARYHGYCADMTRTICLGEPSEPRMREIYEAALHAMRTCEQQLKPGISGVAADALARSALEQAGLAEYFVHSTGHGVGLQIHEAPSLSKRAPEDVPLPAGCVVTVEPGVYIPGWTGTRVEDCVLLTEQGVEVLTQSPTDLVIQR